MSAYLYRLCYNVLEKKERSMKILINSAFYENNKCVKATKKLNAIKTPKRLIYNEGKNQNIIYLEKDNYQLIRNIDSSQFILNLSKKQAKVLLTKNQEFIIPIVKLNYTFTNKKIMIEYQLDIDTTIKKLIITME